MIRLGWYNKQTVHPFRTATIIAALGSGQQVCRAGKRVLERPMPPRNLYLISIITLVSAICHVKAERTRDGALVGESIALLRQYYVDQVDRRSLIEAAMKGLTSELDPYTQFIPASAYDDFQDALQQEFAGIGILIERPENQPFRVITPLVGSPALAAGLKPRDEIIQVDGTETTGDSIEQLSKRLRGPVGTSVRLLVRRAAPPSLPTGGENATRGENATSRERVSAGEPQELEIAIIRQTIQLDSVVGDDRDPNDAWVFHLREFPRIGYVRLTGFGERTTAEFERALRKIPADAAGLILDMRGNSGGLLAAAVDVCDMLLETGRIVSTRGRGVLDPAAAARAQDDQVTWEASPGSLVPEKLPIFVLIDGDSASASEIVAACLQDHRRATIVGQRSFGKGSVQNIFALERGQSALKMTTSRYYRPSGGNIHREGDATEDQEWGVRPDAGFEVPIDEEGRRRFLRRWELSTYPSIATDATEPADGDPAELPLEEVDPQLWRAIEGLLGPAGTGSDAVVEPEPHEIGAEGKGTDGAEREKNSSQ